MTETSYCVGGKEILSPQVRVLKIDSFMEKKVLKNISIIFRVDLKDPEIVFILN